MSNCEMRNGVFLFPSETVVYEEDAWGIIYDTQNISGTYATHRCTTPKPDEERELPMYGEYSWRDLGKKPICGYCETSVPDSIITLVRIHNWQR